MPSFMKDGTLYFCVYMDHCWIGTYPVFVKGFLPFWQRRWVCFPVSPMWKITWLWRKPWTSSKWWTSWRQICTKTSNTCSLRFSTKKTLRAWWNNTEQTNFTGMSFPERQNCESYAKEKAKKTAETLYNIAVFTSLGSFPEKQHHWRGEEQSAKSLHKYIRWGCRWVLGKLFKMSGVEEADETSGKIGPWP